MIITYEDLTAIRNNNPDKKIVFCSGSFDLLHAGHVLFLEDCKKFGDILVVGLGNDQILKLKGKDRPILNEHVRITMLNALRVVDYCFLHKNVEGAYNNLFIEEVFELLKPNVWVINGDATEIEYRKKVAAQYGVDFHILERECPPEFEAISTSNIIKKIRGESI